MFVIGQKWELDRVMEESYVEDRHKQMVINGIVADVAFTVLNGIAAYGGVADGPMCAYS